MASVNGTNYEGDLNLYKAYTEDENGKVNVEVFILSENETNASLIGKQHFPNKQVFLPKVGALATISDVKKVNSKGIIPLRQLENFTLNDIESVMAPTKGKKVKVAGPGRGRRITSSERAIESIDRKASRGTKVAKFIHTLWYYTGTDETVLKAKELLQQSVAKHIVPKNFKVWASGANTNDSNIINTTFAILDQEYSSGVKRGRKAKVYTPEELAEMANRPKKSRGRPALTEEQKIEKQLHKLQLKQEKLQAKMSKVKNGETVMEEPKQPKAKKARKVSEPEIDLGAMIIQSSRDGSETPGEVDLSALMAEIG